MPNINNIPTTQYIGPRIIPHFANPSEWSINREYDALSIVTQGGNTYWAKTNVPAGIQISNTTYWYLSAYPDAQIQQYRAEVQAYAQEVEGYSGRISDLEDDVEDNTRDIGNQQTAINTLNNQVAALQARKKMLVIGDSLSGSTYVQANDRWCVKLANYLNADLYVFSANGAGFADPGSGSKTFQTLVGDAHASTSFNDADIDYVFIFGGTNDINEASMTAACTTAFDATLRLARQYFTNAELYICSTTSRYDHLKLVESTRQGEIYQLKQWRSRYTVRENNAVILPLTFVTAFNASYYIGGDDHIHLNAAGHLRVANAIYSMMHGGIVTSYFSGSIKDASDATVGVLRVNATEFGMQFFGYTTNAAGSEAYIHDDYLITSDAGLNNMFNGIVLVHQGAAGYMGGYVDANNGLHTIDYGAFNAFISYV